MWQKKKVLYSRIMKLEVFPGNVHYYTGLVNDQELKYIIDMVNSIDDWTKVYDHGHKYDPNRKKSANPYVSVMLASRAYFWDDDIKGYPEHYSKISELMNRVLESATQDYAERNGLNNLPPMNKFQSIDRHEIGTCYQTHVDTSPVGMDSRTVLIYVNDNYLGGELSFSLPGKDKKIKIVGGVAQEESSAKVAYPPGHRLNEKLLDYWIKPEAMSVIIFDPLGLPHSAHEVLGAPKYMVKGYWQFDTELAHQWTSNPYAGLTEEDIARVNPEGFVIGDYQHQDILSGKDIVPEEHRSVEY